MSRIDLDRVIDADPPSLALLLSDPTLAGATPLQRTPTGYVGRLPLGGSTAVISLSYAAGPRPGATTHARVRVDEQDRDQACALLDGLAAHARAHATV